MPTAAVETYTAHATASLAVQFSSLLIRLGGTRSARDSFVPQLWNSHASMPTRKAALAEPIVPVGVKVRGKLPSMDSAWVEFTDAEQAILLKHLNLDGIHELQLACEFAGVLYHSRRMNPISISAVRKHLLRIADAAEQLDQCFDLNTRHAMTLISLLEHGCNSSRGMPNATELRRLLKTLSDGCRAQAKHYVGQARRHTPEYQVRCIARVLEPKGFKPSAAPGSRFTRIVRLCFAAMGIHSDPGRAIRSYLEHKDDDPLRA